MKNKKTLMAVIIVAALLFAAVGTTVVAYMFRRTDEKKNTFIPAVVSCEVNETTNRPLTEKSEITIKNTGNIDAYLRLRIVSYWMDSNGNILPKPSVIPTFTAASGWVSGSGNTYYYSSPIEPGASTPNLLAEGSTITLSEEDGALQVVEIISEAIQSKPESAVTDSWKVTVSDGKITHAN